MGAIITTITPRERDLGGFSVRRVLPAAGRQMVGPFIFLDVLGPTTFGIGQGVDVRPHPHIGLATVTWLFEGALLHRDSLGMVQRILPGDVNWMTAGRGIVHSERTPPEVRQAPAPLYAVQSWVALPAAAEEAEPAFAHHPAATLPGTHDAGVRLRVIAGRLLGHASPVRTFSPMGYAAVELEAGASLELPPEYPELGILLLTGDLDVQGEPLVPVSLAVLEPARILTLRARTACRLMLVGGAPADGPRHIWWNFVSSRPERIEQAKRDWVEQRFAAVPGEHERIPLPER